MMRFHFAAVCAALCSLAVQPTARGDHFDAFNPRQIPIELQGWWTPDYGHVHAAVFLPVGQVVSGVLDMVIRVTVHENPSMFYELRFDDEKGILKRVSVGPYYCEQTCVWEFSETLDTNLMQDGWREFRIKAMTRTPDGIRYSNSSGIMLNVQNGGGDKDYHASWQNRLIGRGWYETEGYANAVIENIPLAPLTGPHTFRIRAQRLGTERLCYAVDASHPVPKTDHWPAQGSAAAMSDCFVGDFTCSTCWQDVTVDPGALGLEPGWHSFAARSESPPLAISQCDGCSSERNLLAGVAKLWFYVDGTGESPEAPGQASNPSPYDTETGVTLNPTLTWSAGSGSTMHDVYFGTTTSPALAETITTTSFLPGPLAQSTTYYWRVDEVNAGGTTPGELWLFETGEGPTTAGVTSLSVSTVNVGKGAKLGQATVTVSDDEGTPVAGAVVTGAFSGDFSGSFSVTTNASGIAEFDATGSPQKGKVSFDFCVEDVNPGTALGWDREKPCGSL